MKLYLVRHGAAAPAEENPEQPLTEKGRQDIQRLAVFMARCGVRVARVIHSGRKRAQDTAVLLADVVGPGKVVEEAESGLGPNESTDLLATAAAALTEDVIVVGHQPLLGRMVARLLAGATRRLQRGLGAGHGGLPGAFRQRRRLAPRLDGRTDPSGPVGGDGAPRALR